MNEIISGAGGGSDAQRPRLQEFLCQMYGDQPNIWDDTLTSWPARLRLITNYFT